MIRGRLILLAFLTVLNLFARQGAQTPSGTVAAQQPLASDTPRTTPSGATFTVPAGWSIASQAYSVTLQPSEADTHIVLMDVQGADAAAAVASAWAAYKPDMKRPFRSPTATAGPAAKSSCTRHHPMNELSLSL